MTSVTGRAFSGSREHESSHESDDVRIGVPLPPSRARGVPERASGQARRVTRSRASGPRSWNSKLASERRADQEYCPIRKELALVMGASAGGIVVGLALIILGALKGNIPAILVGVLFLAICIFLLIEGSRRGWFQPQ